MNIHEEEIAFHSQIGHAITQWAYIEFALADIVATHFDKKNAQIARNAFLSIENIRAKLKYVEAVLANRDLLKKYKVDWATLREKTETLAGLRNRIAHSWVKIDQHRKAGRRIMLMPTRPNTKKTWDKYPGALCVRDIVGYQLEFLALQTALVNFCDRLAGRKERSPKSQEQPQRLPTIDQIRHQTLANVQRPLRPSRK